MGTLRGSLRMLTSATSVFGVGVFDEDSAQLGFRLLCGASGRWRLACYTRFGGSQPLVRSPDTKMTTDRQSLPPQVIEPSGRLGLPDMVELWKYRELLFFLVWRDVKVRYKQTVLGVAWAILQPLLAAVVFTLLFGRMAGISSDGVAYPLFSYTGLIVWTFFAQAVTQSSSSLVNAARVITKVYFPRTAIPIAAVLAGLVDLAVTLPLLLVMMLLYRVPVHPAIILVPVFVLLAAVAAVGVGLWLSAVNVQYRDVRYVVPFLVQLWLFLTPVIYPASRVIPYLERFGLPGWLLGLNPVTGVVEGFRWATLGTGAGVGPIVLVSAVSALCLLVTGAMYFRAVERSFADVV